MWAEIGLILLLEILTKVLETSYVLGEPAMGTWVSWSREQKKRDRNQEYKKGLSSGQTGVGLECENLEKPDCLKRVVTREKFPRTENCCQSCGIKVHTLNTYVKLKWNIGFKGSLSPDYRCNMMIQLRVSPIGFQDGYSRS